MSILTMDVAYVCVYYTVISRIVFMELGHGVENVCLGCHHIVILTLKFLIIRYKIRQTILIPWPGLMNIIFDITVPQLCLFIQKTVILQKQMFRLNL